jgi:hypothetical protein
MTFSDFMSFCNMLDKNINFAASGPPAVPFKNPFDTKALQASIKSGTALLPIPYQQGYAQPLTDKIPALVARIRKELQGQSLTAKERTQQGVAFFEPLLGAIYDHDNTAVQKQLNRFLAVISDLYRSFLDRTQRAHTTIPLVEQLPPLATFASTASAGPFTVPSDDTANSFGAEIGVVSLPSSYRDAPIVWPALMHEVGGHDVTHADEGLLPELGAQIEKTLTDSNLAKIWSFWVDEASADVYGLLNIGPSFVFNLAGFFTVLVHQLTQKRTAIGVLGNQSFIDESGLDPHPTDILRIHLAVGVIESLAGMKAADRTAYVNAALDLAKQCANGATTVDIVRINSDGSTSVTQQFPLSQMQDAARTVGSLIATVKLKALNDHSIQDIETWDDPDEQVALGIKQALLNGHPVAGMGDDAQVLAGATLALFQDTSKYQPVTDLVNAAQDASFENDPIFGIHRADHFIQKGRMRLMLKGPAKAAAKARAQSRGA